MFFIFSDEHKLNSGAWEDPLPFSNTSKVVHPIHTIGSRRSDPLGLFTTLNIHKTNINNNHLTPHHNNHSTITSKTRRRLEHTPSAISSEDSWCSERVGSENDLSSEGEDESDRSISSTNIRNSHLRSTLNKAKHHLSFDKWRNSNSSHSSGSGSTATLPPHHDTTPPGESPGGRLSRWFSIRRGSIHQYDLGGSGKDSRSSSIDNDDKSPSIPSTHTSKNCGNKMPQLSEVRLKYFILG